MVLKTMISVLFCSAATLTLADPGHSDSSGQDEKSTFAAGQPGQDQTVDRIIRVEASDQMRFSPNDWTVPSGDTIRFVVTNTGEIPHEFVIDTVQGNAKHRKAMMEAMADGGMMEHDDPNSVSVAPGDTGELTWTFNESGIFEAACNLPGHYQAGMHAQIGVSESTLAHNP